jgi:hypothetical protein
LECAVVAELQVDLNQPLVLVHVVAANDVGGLDRAAHGARVKD